MAFSDKKNNYQSMISQYILAHYYYFVPKVKKLVGHVKVFTNFSPGISSKLLTDISFLTFT